MHLGLTDANHDLTQPASAWIVYDCRSKQGKLGFRFIPSDGEFDLATMTISLSENDRCHSAWEMQMDVIDSSQALLANKPFELSLLNQALGKLMWNVTTTNRYVDAFRSQFRILVVEIVGNRKCSRLLDEVFIEAKNSCCSVFRRK